MTQTLTYRRQPLDLGTDETFTSARALCLRIAEIVAESPDAAFYISQPDWDEPVWVAASDMERRLDLIEARREAVAVALVAERPGHREPSLVSAQSYFDLLDASSRDLLLSRADRLIAAYEGASV